MTDQPRGTGAGGREDPMTPTRLRECLQTLGWTQRELASILDFRDDATTRAWARGKSRIWPVIADWLERLVAFQEGQGFPIGVLWWHEGYAGEFEAAAEATPSDVVRAWLRDAIAFFSSNRWPASDWRVDVGAAQDGEAALEDLKTLGLRLYGDVGRALLLEMREAKSWQRRPRNMPGAIMDWLHDLAEFKRQTGFPLHVFCLNTYLTENFNRALCNANIPRPVEKWLGAGLRFYEAKKYPQGFELSLEQQTDEGTQAASSALNPPGQGPL